MASTSSSSSPSNLPPLQTVFSSHERPPRPPHLSSNPPSLASTPKSASPAARMKSADPLLSRLTPATITKMSDLDFLPGEKEVGVWAATSAEKIENWLREVESWESLTFWSKKNGEGFKVPEDTEQRKKRRKIDLSRAAAKADRERKGKPAALPVARRLFPEAGGAAGTLGSAKNSSNGLQLDRSSKETISLSKIDELLSPTTTPLPVKRLDLDLSGTPTTPSRMHSGFHAPMSPFDKSSKRRSLQVTGFGNGGQALATTPTPLKRQTFDFSPSHRLSNSISGSSAAANYRPSSSPTKTHSESNPFLTVANLPTSSHLSPNLAPTSLDSIATDSEADGGNRQTSDSDVSDGEASDEDEFLGSLPTSVVNHISTRVVIISTDLSQLDIEGLKSRVLHFKSQQIDELGNGHMSDSLAVITATTLQLLPPLHRLWHLLETWGWRLEVCKVVPTFLANLEKAEMIIMRGGDEGANWAHEVQSAVGEEAVTVGTLRTLEIGVDEVWEKRKTEVADTVGLCGKIVDGMLDLLDGREETIPDDWIDRLEEVEAAMENWVFREGSKAEELKQGWRGVIRRKREEEERQRRELLERLRREEEERLKKEAEEKLRKLEEERLRREEEERLRKAEEDRLRKEEEERLRREEEERIRRAEEERLRLEEEERLRKAEEVRIRQAEEEARRVREAEEEKLRQEEAERIRIEQEELARKAEQARQRELAEEEAARRLAEEEQERRRAEQLRIQELEERQRKKYEELERLEREAEEEEEARKITLEAQKASVAADQKDMSIDSPKVESQDPSLETPSDESSSTGPPAAIVPDEIIDPAIITDVSSQTSAVTSPPAIQSLEDSAEASLSPVIGENAVETPAKPVATYPAERAVESPAEPMISVLPPTAANSGTREVEVTGDGKMVEILPLIVEAGGTEEEEEEEEEEEDTETGHPAIHTSFVSSILTTQPSEVSEPGSVDVHEGLKISSLPPQMQVPILTPIVEESLTPAVIIKDPLEAEHVVTNAASDAEHPVVAVPVSLAKVEMASGKTSESMTPEHDTEVVTLSTGTTFLEPGPITTPNVVEETEQDSIAVAAVADSPQITPDSLSDEPKHIEIPDISQSLPDPISETESFVKEVATTHGISASSEPVFTKVESALDIQKVETVSEADSEEPTAESVSPLQAPAENAGISTNEEERSVSPAPSLPEVMPVVQIESTTPVENASTSINEEERSVSGAPSLPEVVPAVQIETATPIEATAQPDLEPPTVSQGIPVVIEAMPAHATDVTPSEVPPDGKQESAKVGATGTPVIEVTMPEDSPEDVLTKPRESTPRTGLEEIIASMPPPAMLVSEISAGSVSSEPKQTTPSAPAKTSKKQPTKPMVPSSKEILAEKISYDSSKPVSEPISISNGKAGTKTKPQLKSTGKPLSKAAIPEIANDDYVSDVDDSDAATVSDDEEFQAELRKEMFADDSNFRRGSEVSIISDVSSIADVPTTPQIKTPDTGRSKKNREARIIDTSLSKSSRTVDEPLAEKERNGSIVASTPRTPKRTSQLESPKLSSPFLPILGNTGGKFADKQRHDSFDSIASRTNAFDQSFNSVNSLEVARELTSPLSPTGSVIIRRDSNSFGASFSSVFSDDTIPDVAGMDDGGDMHNGDGLSDFRRESVDSASTEVSPVKESYDDDSRFRYSMSSDGSNLRLEEPETSPVKVSSSRFSREEARGQAMRPNPKTQPKKRQSSISSISSSTSGRSSTTSERAAKPVQAQGQPVRHVRHVSSIPTIAPPRRSLHKEAGTSAMPQNSTPSHSYSHSVAHSTSKPRLRDDTPSSNHRPTTSVSNIPRKASSSQIATPMPTTRALDRNELASVKKRSSIVETRDITPKASAQDLRNIPSRSSLIRPSSVASLRGQNSRHSLRGVPSGSRDPTSPTLEYSVRAQSSRQSMRAPLISQSQPQLPHPLSPTYDPNQVIKVVKRKSHLVSKPQIRVADGVRDNGATSPTSPVDFSPIRPMMNPPPSTPMKGRELEDRLERKINKILIGLPSLTMTPSPMKRAPPMINTAVDAPIKQPKFGESKLPIPRVPSTPTIGQAPNLTLSSKRTISQPGEVKMYHLHRSDEESPVKLFVRLVGDKGERVMVRVGGGWADLKEYLIEYAAHHGIQGQRRITSESIVEFGEDARSLRASNSNSSLRSSYRRSPTPTFNSRPNSPLPGGVKVPVPSTSRGNTPSRAESPGLISTKNSPGLRLGGGAGVQNIQVQPPRDSPTTPGNDRPGTPGSAGFHPLYTSPSYSGGLSANYRRPTSRLSFGEGMSGMDLDSPSLSPVSTVPLGLAGPKSRNVEISAEKQAWVDGMLGQVRKASAERNVRLGLNHMSSVGSLQSAADDESIASGGGIGGGGSGTRLAEMGKVGGTRRMYITKQPSYASLQKGMRSSSSNLGRATPAREREKEEDGSRSTGKG